jgi:hypothetical protein
MESRIYNAVRLGKTSELALRQLRASVICAREYSGLLLDAEELPGEQRVRAVLGINKRIADKCLKDLAFTEAHEQLGVDTFDAVLVDARLPAAFHEEYLRRVQAALAKLRGGRSTGGG